PGQGVAVPGNPAASDVPAGHDLDSDSTRAEDAWADRHENGADHPLHRIPDSACHLGDADVLRRDTPGTGRERSAGWRLLADDRRADRVSPSGPGPAGGVYPELHLQLERVPLPAYRDGAQRQDRI